MFTKLVMSFALVLFMMGCANDSSSNRGLENGRNVILIIIDTLRADHLSCYGYSRNTSPTIDSLASTGTLWSHAQTQAPWTLPSHASIWTGLSVKSHGTTHIGGIDGFDLGLDKELPSLPVMLQNSNIQTAGFTNFFLLSDKYGFNHGFDWYDCNDNGERTISTTVDSFLSWLDDEASNDNFFTVLHFYDVHAPYDPLIPFDTAFCNEGVNGVTNWERTDDGQLLNPEDCQHLIDMYDSEILYVDTELSRLFSELRARGVTDNTLFIITSDHGEEFLEHGSIGHGHALYSEQIVIPLIFSGPEIETGTVSSTHAALYDLMPTILTYLGTEVPVTVEGIDLLACEPNLIRSVPSGGVSADRFLLAQYPLSHFQSCAVVEGKRKAIAYMGIDEIVQFDLAEDPGEQAPMPADSEMTEKALYYWATPLLGNPLPIEDLSDENLRILNDLGYVN